MNKLKVKKYVFYVVTFTCGACTFFFCLPFLYSKDSNEFAQWLQGMAGPLGFISVLAIALTVLLQQQQNERSVMLDKIQACDRLVDAYEKILQGVELIRRGHHLAPDDHRRGYKALDIIYSNYIKNKLFQDHCLPEPISLFFSDYQQGLFPMITTLNEVWIRMEEMPFEAKSSGLVQALRERLKAIIRDKDREILLEACVGLKQLAECKTALSSLFSELSGSSK